MQVSVETTQGLERRLTISVPAEQIENTVKEALKSEAKRARIPGFRPGKVPVSVINKRYGNAIRQDITGEVMQRNFVEAIIAEKLNPAGAPTFVPGETDAENFQFVATFEIYPEVELKGLEAIEVEQPKAEVTDADVDAMIDTLRKQHATFEAVERAAADGDKAKIDFVGSIDGEEFEGGKAEDFELQLGSGRMIPGFESGVEGHKAGEEFEIDVTFPEDYHAENLKGKVAKFAITLKEVQAANLPEVNDEFAKLFGVVDGGLEALKTEITKNMTRELEQALKANVKEQVLNGLLAQNEIELPKALIDGEVNVLRQQAMQRFGDQAANMPELPADLFTEQAERRVKVGLLLGEVIKTNELKAEDERVQALIASMASAYEDPSEVVEYYNSNQEMMQNMRNVALEEQAVEALLNSAKVTEKDVNFEEFMNKATGRA
ncbi:trigger factor [Shewanella colwelliana]|uniref:Trigger factor n=1 Tax=Shewanella colwelliana TaxID=23 RepID=A0A1E5IVW1_SHECO|nr:trigger factor [Shewanella colwelliana]MDX1281249.1 trigger factor [Shewanella colwelliana]OEG74719.1 trigger factor [Shewanella colwelliana]GIU30237.1 trigger factor [Shewanella colwelliana]GIU36126.1 trigger factor [Shewanella colwelliana]